MTTLLGLPVELLESILAELTVPDLTIARNVCKRWRELCDCSTAIPIARRKLVEFQSVARADGCTAVLARILEPFAPAEFHREEYISRVGSDVPEEFRIWALETPFIDMIGWHCFGLHEPHNSVRYKELGIDWLKALYISRDMNPGYTLLPYAKVMMVEDPDYSEYNNTDHTYYPGSWQRPRPFKAQSVRALQIWEDLDSTTWSSITLLLLSGSDRWDGTVWLTEARIPYRYSVDIYSASPTSLTRDTPLTWIRPMGSWSEYLKNECKLLQEKHRALPRPKSITLSIGAERSRGWLRQAH